MTFHFQKHKNQNFKKSKKLTWYFGDSSPLECHVLFEWPLKYQKVFYTIQQIKMLSLTSVSSFKILQAFWILVIILNLNSKVLNLSKSKTIFKIAESFIKKKKTKHENNSHTDFSLKQLLNFGKRRSETGTLLLLVWWLHGHKWTIRKKARLRRVLHLR